MLRQPDRRKPGIWQTLRFRFALWTAGLLFAVLTAFGAFVYFTMSRGLSASIDDSLRINASQAIAAIEVEDGRLELPDGFIEGPQFADLTAQGFTYRLLDPDGQLLWTFGSNRSLPLEPDSFAAASQQRPSIVTIRDTVTEDKVRVHTTPMVNNGQVIGVVQVVQSLAGVQDTLNRLVAAMLIGVPLLAVVAGLGGYWLAARALAPIDRITLTARRISAQDLSARLDLPATDDEVGRLAATLDEMLARLDQSFRRERQFTADASHELRTPLAAMQAIVSTVSQKRRSPTAYEQALADLTEEIERLRSLTEALLLLARRDAHPVQPSETIDLSTLLSDVVESLRPLAEAKNLTLTCAIPAGLTIAGDTDGLIRLFANLIDNAIKYTDHGQITIHTQPPADGILQVTVADTGRGIPPEHLPRVFDRFYRVDKARTERGVGLGLAIARDIAQAHHGAIAVSSTVDQGTTLTVQLPVHR